MRGRSIYGKTCKYRSSSLFSPFPEIIGGGKEAVREEEVEEEEEGILNKFIFKDSSILN